MHKPATQNCSSHLDTSLCRQSSGSSDPEWELFLVGGGQYLRANTLYYISITRQIQIMFRQKEVFACNLELNVAQGQVFKIGANMNVKQKLLKPTQHFPSRGRLRCWVFTLGPFRRGDISSDSAHRVSRTYVLSTSERVKIDSERLTRVECDTR